MSKWTPERLKKDRESWEAKNNSRTTNRTASTGTAAGTANTTDKWTPERIAKARESWEAKSSRQNVASPAAAARQNTGAGLGARVLAQMTGADSGHKLQLAVPQETGNTQAYPGKSGIVTDSGTGTHSSTPQPEWLNAKNAAAPAAKVTGTVQPTERQRIAGIASGDEGWYAQTAQKVKQYTEDLKATDDFSDFDRLNQWMDADPKHRELVTLMRIGTGGQSYAEKNNAMQPQSVSGAAAGAAVPEKSAGRRDYTDAELLAKGYSRKEISEARQYIADFDALPAGQRAARRAANTIGGIGDTVASSVFLAGETGVQSAKNAAATSSNWKQLQQDVQNDDRQQELLRLMTGGKTRYAARDNTLQLAQSSGAMASAPAAQTTQSDAYTDAELIEKGYTQQEIDNMRARIAGTEAHDSVDPEKSFGYQLYKRGRDLTAAAQAGLSPIAKQALGIVSSAGENLAVAAIDPAWVLPVLSAQGGAEAMGQSVEKGESAGKTLAGGLAKFGAGWAINSVGAADLAKTMGSDYAKNTLAGKLADMVRSVAADGTLAQRYPAVANAISGGVDNAMQAFVETYADKAIDATLGDSEAAADLFKSDTFLTALESGLTGGASGALGGAVGTGLAKANGGDASIVGNVKQAYYEGQVERARQALQDEVRAQEPGTAMQQTPEEAAAGTRQPAAATQETVQPEVTGTTSGFATMQDTAPMVQSENPAVQQLAAAVQDGQLTSKTINLFTPNAANEANRAAFAEEYGIELPETAAKTRQVLREMTTQQRAAQAPATATENATVEAQKTAAIVEKMEADRSAQQAQTESELGRSGAAVENTGERVESGPAEQSGRMRETYGLEQQSLTTKQREVQQELTRWQVSDGASATISRNMPTEIGDAGRYAAAASSLYRLGQMEDVHTFDKAMELVQGMSGLAVNTDYVLAQDGGREALQLAWLQGHGELEAGKMQRASLGGRLTAESTSGSGRVLYKGTMRTANEVGTQLIELNAKATNTDAVLKTVLQGSDRVRAYVDTETARIFFSDRAEDVFGTILHEDYHWYNSLDAEGAQALQQHALEFLAKSEGFEGIDEMIRGKLSDYARQGLSYEEAAEELVADAWRGIFSDEASFKRWVEFQRGQAEKNAGKAGGIHKVMTKVKELLSDIVSRAKEVLARDPENKAALKAQRLAVAEKRVLQDEYFAHAERAMDSLRAAKENAAALENKGAAEGARFKLQEGEETLEEQLNHNLDQLEQMHPAAEITGKEIAYGATNKENAENIVRFFESVGSKVERAGFGTVELTRKGAKATVQHGNGPVKQIAAAAIPDVIRYGEQVGFVENWKGREYSLIDNAVNGKDYDVLSAASISVVNDLAGDVQKFFAEFRKDTSEMDEEQLQKHHNKLMQRSMTLLEDSFEVAGVPYGNGRKIVEAVKGYYGDLENLAHGGQFSFNSVPQSATGQYDRLYNAYAGGDSDEAKAAVEKLNAMVEAGTITENKMYSQLKSRLVKYDVRVRQAAEEQNAGNDQKRYELENEMIEQLSEVLGLPKGKRGDVVDCVTGAVNQLAEKQLKGDNASVTDDLVEAVDSWDAGAVQEEYDRLAKAGKSATTLKSKITETAKPEYLAGSDADRQQMEKMLLALKDADGEELYTEKNFAQWVEEAEKKAEEGPKPDPYAAVR